MMPALGPSPGVLTISIVALALLALGVALLALLSLIPQTAAAARAIWPNLVAALVVAAAVLASFLAGGWVLILVLMAFAARIGWEAAITCLPAAAAGLARPVGAGAALATGLAALAGPMPLLPVLAVAWGALLALRLGAGQRLPQQSTARGLLDLLLYPLLPLVGFATGAADSGLAQVVLIAFVLVETFDSYAVVAGRVAGRTLAFPRLSPRKTVEGLVGGAAMLALTAALAGPLLFDIAVWQAVLVAALAGALAVAGDLAASRLKRLRGVKDYPRLMAHQGGLLDIADAWIAAGAGLALALALAGAAIGGHGG